MILYSSIKIPYLLILNIYALLIRKYYICKEISLAYFFCSEDEIGDRAWVVIGIVDIKILMVAFGWAVYFVVYEEWGEMRTWGEAKHVSKGS